MNSWFTVKVKYTRQLEDGTFKRVSEPYLVAAMTFTDAEARIYEELGSIIRGEFMVTHITRTDVHDIFHYEDADTWYKCIITYEAGGDGGEEGAKAKKVSQTFLVSANSVKEANGRLNESLSGMMIDYNIKSVVLSPLVDIFPFGDDDENSDSSDKMPLADIALSEGYTLYNGNATCFPNDGEVVNVIFENGTTGTLTFWNPEEGFDAQTEPHHISVIAWKSIHQYSDEVKEHFRQSNSE